MPKAICRCGETLAVPTDGTDRMVCPKCGARVRLRRPPSGEPTDGFIRFLCPCGRRLKVSAERSPTHGKCPDCGRVVPVPAATSSSARPPSHPDADTTELSPDEVAALERWARERASRVGVSLEGIDEGAHPTPVVAVPPTAQTTRAEAGLRVCPNCRKPVHMGAEACRSCGTPVPRK